MALTLLYEETGKWIDAMDEAERVCEERMLWSLLGDPNEWKEYWRKCLKEWPLNTE